MIDAYPNYGLIRYVSRNVKHIGSFSGVKTIIFGEKGNECVHIVG